MKKNLSIFGERLEEARNAKGLKQNELAALIGLKYSSISKYKYADEKPPTHRLRRLADVLGVSVDWLLGRDNESLSEISSHITGDLLSYQTIANTISTKKEATRSMEPQNASDWAMIAKVLADQAQIIAERDKIRAEKERTDAETRLKAEQNRELEIRFQAQIAEKRIEQVESLEARAKMMEQERLSAESAQLRQLLGRALKPEESIFSHPTSSPGEEEQVIGR